MHLVSVCFCESCVEMWRCRGRLSRAPPLTAHARAMEWEIRPRSQDRAARSREAILADGALAWAGIVGMFSVVFLSCYEPRDCWLRGGSWSGRHVWSSESHHGPTPAQDDLADKQEYFSRFSSLSRCLGQYFARFLR